MEIWTSPSRSRVRIDRARSQPAMRNSSVISNCPGTRREPSGDEHDEDLLGQVGVYT